MRRRDALSKDEPTCSQVYSTLNDERNIRKEDYVSSKVQKKPSLEGWHLQKAVSSQGFHTIDRLMKNVSKAKDWKIQMVLKQ